MQSSPNHFKVSHDQILKCCQCVSRHCLSAKAMWVCWLSLPRNADKARQRDPPEIVRLSTWAEIYQNICEVDWRLIGGLISSVLVLIRQRNGGKAGGILTTANGDMALLSKLFVHLNALRWGEVLLVICALSLFFFIYIIECLKELCLYLRKSNT